MKELRNLDLEPDSLVDDDVETKDEMILDEVCTEDKLENRVMLIDDNEAVLESTMMNTDVETKDDLIEQMTTEDTLEERDNP